MPDLPAPGEDESLTEAFWTVAGRLRQLSHQAVAPLGVTPSQGRALGMLRRHGQLRLSDLADHLRIAARSATEVVDALEERHLAQRLPDPQDRRATLVQLTTEGERVAEAVRAARRDGADTYFSALSPDDRETLARLLRALRET